MPNVMERPPPEDKGPKKELCLICGEIVEIYPELGVMWHASVESDMDHLPKVKE